MSAHASVRLAGHADPLLIQAGGTLGELVHAMVPAEDLRPWLEVYVRGQRVPRTEWAGVRLLPGDTVLVGIVPAGDRDGGKEVVTSVLSLAIVAFASTITLGTSALLTAAVRAGVTVAGHMALNAMVPPAVDAEEPSAAPLSTPTPLSGANVAERYGIVPRVYGTHRFRPPLAAVPDVTNTGTQSWLRAIYDAGLGEVAVDVASITIGDRPLANLTVKDHELHVDDADPTLRLQTEQVGYTQLGLEPAVNEAVELEVTPYVDQVTLQMALPRGLYETSGGGTVAYTARLEGVEWEDLTTGQRGTTITANQGTYTPATKVWELTGTFTRPWQAELTFTLPARGHYRLHLTRASVAGTGGGGQTVNDLQLLALKHVRTDAPLNLHQPHTLLELEVNSSPVQPIDTTRVELTGTSVLRTTLDGQTFNRKATSNPAWVLLDILTGTANDLPLSDELIDWPSFLDFAKYCDQRVGQDIQGTGTKFYSTRHTLNLVVAQDQTVAELVRNVLASCRASLKITPDGKYGVLIDRPQTVPRQLITPENSWGFQAARTYEREVHGFRVHFIDGLEDVVAAGNLGAGDYQPAEIIAYADGKDELNHDPRAIEDLPAVGITNWWEAYRFGRYMLQQLHTRTEQFSVKMDVENLVCSRGDLVHVAHDVPSLGGWSTRVTDVAGAVVEVELPMPTHPADYVVRLSDGTQRQGTVVNVIDDRHVELDDATGVQPDDLIVLGAGGTVMATWNPLAAVDPLAAGAVVEPYLVTRITPGPDLSAELTLVRYDPHLYDIDTEPLPDWRP